jgi:3-oxoacyl-[acyl-carrier protein] reductase
MNIIITGASKGIGFAIAKTLAMQNEKHCIGICSRHENEITKVATDLQAISPQHKYFARECDVSNELQVNSFVAEFEQKFGAIDALINNAGFGIFKPVTELTKKEFESVLSTNLRGVFLFTRAALPKMREKESGTIITINSVAGKQSYKGGAAYNASKFAVRGLMECLFLEVRADNIRCVTIYPGSVETDFFATAGHPEQTQIQQMLSITDIAACVKLALNLPQQADITEIEIRPTNTRK